MTTTYDELEQAWRREFQNPELQTLRQGFLRDLSSYVKRLRDAQRNVDPKSLKATVIEEELLRLEQLLSSLLDRRLAKLWSQATLTQGESLEYAEKQAYQAFTGLYRDYERMKQDLIQGREPSTSISKEKEFVLVRFVRDVPSIIGVDLKTHGPFRKEDIARLPHENAESLIRQGTAIEVRAPGQDNE